MSHIQLVLRLLCLVYLSLLVNGSGMGTVVRKTNASAMAVSCCRCSSGIECEIVVLKQRRDVDVLWSSEALRCDMSCAVILTEYTMDNMDSHHRMHSTSSDDVYHNSSSLDALYRKFSSERIPGLRVDVQRIGNSYEGRDITAVCLTSLESSPTQVLLVAGGHHAREWISVEVSARMIDMFRQHFNVNTRIRRLLRLVRLCVVPNVNPDGFAFTWQSGWEGNHPKRMWRKNRHVFENGFIGVDLNRNYNVAWNADRGASTSPGDETYRGPGALSEHESSAFYAWQSALPVIGFISFHSYGKQIMFPLGYDVTVFGPNEGMLRSLGTAMRDAMVNTTGAVYDVMKAADSYPCSGDAVDAVYVSHRYVPSFTIETRPGLFECCGFVLDPKYIDPTTRECFSAVALLGEYVAGVVSSSSLVDWSDHVFDGTKIVPVTPESFTTADWDPHIEFVEDDGSQWISGWISDVRGVSTTLAQGAHISLMSLLDCGEAEVEVRRAVFILMWECTSVVVRFRSTNRTRSLELIVRLGRAMDGYGPLGRPSMSKAFAF